MAYLHGNGSDWRYLAIQADPAEVVPQGVKAEAIYPEGTARPYVLERLCMLHCAPGTNDNGGTEPENLTNMHLRIMLGTEGSTQTVPPDPVDFPVNLESAGDDAAQGIVLAANSHPDKLGYWRPLGTGTQNDLARKQKILHGNIEYGLVFNTSLWVAAHAYQGGSCGVLVVFK